MPRGIFLSLLFEKSVVVGLFSLKKNAQKQKAMFRPVHALALLALLALASARVHLLDPKNYEFKVSHCAEHCFVFVVDSSKTEVPGRPCAC